MSAGIGTVSIRKTHVVARENGEDFTLLFVPDDRYISLDESGRALWEAIDSGQTDIGTLISSHAKAQGLAEAWQRIKSCHFWMNLDRKGLYHSNSMARIGVHPYLMSP